MNVDRIWSATLVTLAACAVVTTGLVIRRELVGRPEAAISAPKTVSSWRTFAQGGHRLGPVDARITIVEFSDFECPFCAQLAVALRDIRRAYPRDVAVIYRHFPLEGLHPFARAAAVAAECAAAQGRFEEYHDLLFSLRDSLMAVSWTDIAKRARVEDASRFQSCLGSRDVSESVAADIAAGNKLPVVGTPTVLVNELMLPGTPSYASLDSVIAQLMRRARP